MPIPFAVAAGLGLTSTALGLYDVIKGGASARKAEQATQSLAKELEDVKVKNMMADLKVPTRGADLAREAGAERYATSVAAAQSAGAEGVIGLLPKLGQQQARQDLAIGAQLEQAEAQRDRARAQGAQQAENANVAAQRKMGMMRLQGAAQAAAEGRRRQQAGLQSAIGGLGQAAALGLEYSPLYGKASKKQAVQQEMQAIQGDNTFANMGKLAPMSSTPDVSQGMALAPNAPFGLEQSILHAGNPGMGSYTVDNQGTPVFNPPMPYKPLYQGLSTVNPIADPTIYDLQPGYTANLQQGSYWGQ
mgnify:CR=1 FL=1|tara:strand:+ start:234 stop:1145 length:912 start_codon:yes stop_codon:yes gene_type:complete